MQRPHPAQRPGLPSRPQRIDFGHGKFLMISGTISAMIFGRRPARLFDEGDIELALLRVGIDLRLGDRGQPGRFRKPWIACSGAPTRGP